MLSVAWERSGGIGDRWGGDMELGIDGVLWAVGGFCHQVGLGCWLLAQFESSIWYSFLFFMCILIFDVYA